MRRFILLASTLFVLLLSCQTTTDDYISPLALSDAPLEEKLEAFGGIPVDVPMPEMYFDGTEWLSRLTEEFSSAGDYILISTFLGSSSSALEPMYRALMDAAERGVDVYLLIDGVSSYDMTETSKYMTPLYFLRDSGVHLVEYAPVSAMRLMNPAALIIRDHRKLVVIDGDTAVIGGMNMNFISMGAGEGKTQRDSMYLFHSASLSEALMHEFVDIWNAASVEKLDYDDFPIAGDNGGEYRAYLFNRGSGSEASISGMYASLLGSAQSDILMFPYLPVLDKKLRAGFLFLGQLYLFQCYTVDFLVQKNLEIGSSHVQRQVVLYQFPVRLCSKQIEAVLRNGCRPLESGKYRDFRSYRERRVLYVAVLIRVVLVQ